MTTKNEVELKKEIQHIFDSGANEVRIFEMVKTFIERRYIPLNINNEPKRPLTRVLREGVGRFCVNCGSTVSRNGFLGLFGEMLCHNQNCPNSKSKKIYR